MGEKVYTYIDNVEELWKWMDTLMAVVFIALCFWVFLFVLLFSFKRKIHIEEKIFKNISYVILWIFVTGLFALFLSLARRILWPFSKTENIYWNILVVTFILFSLRTYKKKKVKR